MKDEILSRIEKEVGERNWKKWFSGFDVLSIEPDRVVFSVTNLFVKDWLLKKYGNVLRKVVKEVLGDGTFEIVHSETEKIEDEKPLFRKVGKIVGRLNGSFTFENFVVGRGNEKAYKFARKAAKEPGRFSPLFIHGGVGLGKTHLIQAVGNEAIKLGFDVVYVTSERFMNEMINSIRENRMEEFRKRYRNVDVFLMDDVQFLMGKNGVQFELFNTFNELMDSKKQLIFCSDRSPDDLQDFQERLISRFKMGIVVEIEPPDVETRFEIAKVMNRIEGGRLDENILRFLAENVDGSLRELRGAIIKLIAYEEIERKRVGIQEAVSLLENFLKPVREIDPTERLMGILSTIFDVSPSEIRGRSRKPSASIARGLGMYFAKKYMKMPSEIVGKAFNRSPSVVSRTVSRFEKEVRSNPVLAGYLRRIISHFSLAVGRNEG